jgi:lipopolysaccharide transport system ATP-binding protein
MSTVISVENVSKAYRLGLIGGGTLKEDFARWCAKLQGKADPTLKIGEEHHARRMGETFWALEDVSFEVKEGEVLGIIGRNGAGKSTLLKILSQVTSPTSGQIKIKGRIASLLEVGTGFHPELTGRENVFLNGAILGMTKAEIRKKFDEIVAFAGIDEFIDSPVKRYSSGMYVRLAFAVAAHLEPEILIVDEVLAVGDAEFQRKCLGKLDSVAESGRTILFVSHNMGTVANLCNRVVWLNGGKTQEAGPARSVVARYAAEGTALSKSSLQLEKLPRGPGLGERVRFEHLEWLTPLPLVYGQPVRVRLSIRARSAVEMMCIGIGINVLDGPRLLTFESDAVLPNVSITAGTKCVYDLIIPQLTVTPGRYEIDLGIRSGDRIAIDGLNRAANIEIVGAENTPSYILQHVNSGVRMSGDWIKIS